MRIGPYEIVSTLGHGGMGVVFGARSPDGSSVAVKLLHRKDAGTVARFDRERRLLGALGEKDGFVPLIDSGEIKDGPYIVMPLLNGGTLRHRIMGGPLSVEETSRLGRTLARALGAAHARGVVHRDMKPENILFSADGRPLIADLGLAKHFDKEQPGASQSVSLSAHGGIRGTAGYMAKEQMLDAKMVGPRTDVFALGVILYECLTGTPPFVADDLVALVATVTAGRFESLAARRPDAPRALVAAIEKALAPDAADRPADGAAFARELAADPGSSLRLRGVAAAGAALLLVVVVGGAAFAARGGRGPETPPAPPPDPARPVVAPPSPPAKRGGDNVDAALQMRRGDALVEARDPDGAIAAFSKAIELDPTCLRAWLRRGNVLALKGDDKGAIDDFTRALDIDASSATVLWARAMSRIRIGDAPNAAADIDRCLHGDPKMVRAYVTRAELRERSGDIPLALTDRTRAVELDPTVAKRWAERAQTRLLLSDGHGALSDADRAIELDQECALAWSCRARARHLVDPGADIADDLRRARLIERREQDAKRVPTAEAAMLRLGDQGPAVKRLQDALRARGLDPGPVPGTFTQTTDSSVRRFQRTIELEADGCVGKITRTALGLEGP